MSHPGDAQGQPTPCQGQFLLPNKTAYTTGGYPTAQRGCPMALGDTAPTAYPASGKAYPMVPCVPSKLTHTTGKIQPASKERISKTANRVTVNSEYGEYSE